MKKQWNILAGDNRGSGIIVVLISMVCVGLMGASLMFMSYTAIRLKATERQASKDFYSAETAVDEIRAGIQSTVSEAIASSYKYALETYSGGTDIEKRFEKRFVANLMKARLFEDVDFDTEDNFLSAEYVVDTLEAYVSNPDDVEVNSIAGSIVTRNEVENTLLLKGIEVEYKAPNNGYTTKISTDISVGMPKFVYTATSTNFAGLPQHALIAKTALNQTTGSSKIAISGSAYVGAMNLAGAGNQLTIANGTLVCAEAAKVAGAGPSTGGPEFKPGRLVTDKTVKFWAGRIVVDGESSINLDGETRVLDDLELAGLTSQAKLSGIYYGFGNGTSDDGESRDQANRSSAILVNGLNSKLDISGLQQLILAGRAHISNSFYGGAFSGTDGIPTVESISVRSNQQMYLIDPYYLDGVDQNPDFTNATGVLNAAGQKLQEQYKFDLVSQSNTYPGTGETVCYYFMQFENPSDVNEYFEAYFKENASNMNRYLVNGEALSNLNPTNGSIYSLGYTIQNDKSKEGAYAVSRPSGAISAEGIRSAFNQLKTTLVDANTTPGVSNPYDYIVDKTMLNQLADGEVRTFTWYKKDGSGNVIDKIENIAVVTKGDYSITGSNPNLRLVITAANPDKENIKGDVIVSAEEYSGLIISAGTIHLQQGVKQMSANPDLVMDAFDAVDSTGTSLREYLRDGITGSDNGETNSGWKLDTLVTCKNWTKS